MITKYCCYPDECWAHGSEEYELSAPWAGPCWGESVVIDEDYYDDEDGCRSDSTWIHACEGHRERYGKYVAQPTGPDAGLIASTD